MSPPVPLAPQRWIAKIILAVIVGEAIWGLLVSLTNGLIVPGLARVMGGDPQSPVYLGKGDFNLTAIFVSVLELCLAGIVAILLNQWSRSGVAGTRVRTIKVRTVAAGGSLPSIAPTSPPPLPDAPVRSTVTPPPPPPPVATPPVPVAMASFSPVVPKPAASKPAVPVAKAETPAKPEKPKKPHEVYYNIVGEPINPTEDDR